MLLHDLLGVVLLTAQALVINRLAGVPYPLWARADGAAVRSERAPDTAGQSASGRRT